MRIQVDAENGQNSEIVPQRLHFDRGPVNIKEVRDRWHGADHQYFKVIGDDGNLYILHLNECCAAWSLIMFVLGANVPFRPPPLPRRKQHTLQ